MKKKVKNPIKKNDMELWAKVSAAISSMDYVFVKHAKARQEQRNILDIDVLDILENKEGRKRKRNKSKDSYTVNHKDWNYCIEGCDLDEDEGDIRIIISFDEQSMLVITVIRLDETE